MLNEEHKYQHLYLQMLRHLYDTMGHKHVQKWESGEANSSFYRWDRLPIC